MRNIGNLCVNTDHSMLAALQYSVEVLGVRMAMSVNASRNPQLVAGADGPHVLGRAALVSRLQKQRFLCLDGCLERPGSRSNSRPNSA